MRIALRIVIGLMVLVALALCAGFFLPRQVHVERTANISAPRQTVFDLVNRPQSWETWTPWGKDRDPSVEMKYGGPDSGVGAWFSWTSDKMGAGKLTLTTSEPPQKIVYELRFIDQDQITTGAMHFAEVDGKTQVTWSFDGDMGMNPISRWVGLFFDKLLGGDFETGLANLKQVSEEKAGGKAANPAK
jgi:uncharacterized protein YndB with AHSA1/START domain